MNNSPDPGAADAAPGNVRNWICEICSKKFKKMTMNVLHIFDKVVCDKCYDKSEDKEYK